MGRRRFGGPALSVKGDLRIEKPTAGERAIIRRASESRATIPTLELSLARSESASLASEIVVKACALALGEHPRTNAAYRDGRYELYSRINIGLLVADEATYAIPTLFDADRKDLAQLAAEIAGLRDQARAGTLAAPAVSGATFTVWNAGELGLAAAAMPVVAPQAAALAVGLRDLVLACDHRILYGGRAAGFLEAVAHHLDRLGA